jgi:glycosyltransferase involved in cell wall biosynthesis
MNDHRPLRVLHVVGGMNRGGVETWLMHVLRHIDRSVFHMDFLVHTQEPCLYDDEIRSYGSNIIPCLHPSRPLRYADNFARALRDYGPYQVLHSHVHHYSGVTLRLAYQRGIPVRIAHSHNDTVRQDADAGLGRKLYLAAMTRLIGRYATVQLACSARAGRSLLRRRAAAAQTWETLYYGIDMAPFDPAASTGDGRAEFGIPPQACVVGHVGRFDEQKNHTFLIDIAAELARRDPTMCLLLVGDGPLRPSIEMKVSELGLARNVRFAGVRSDVPRLMKCAMDVFLFPSLFEGLGLVLVEAQAAGLPCVFSDVVPQEADVVGPLIRRVALSQPASVWADAVVKARDPRRIISKSAAFGQARQSAFNIEAAVKRVEQVYARAGCAA